MEGAVKRSKNEQFLFDHGWRFITEGRSQYGKIYYWDHPDHQKSDGRWWVQGDAVALQRRLNKKGKQ